MKTIEDILFFLEYKREKAVIAHEHFREKRLANLVAAYDEIIKFIKDEL